MFKINTKFNAKIFTDNILKIIEDVSNEALVLSLREIGKLGVSNAKMTGNYKNTDRLTKYGLYLPSSSNLESEQIEYICKLISSFADKFTLN